MSMKIPNITLNASDGKSYAISDFTETDKILLYFYPKDNTPGCTKQAVDFTNLKQEFSDKNIMIIGVSPDSVESHKKFIEKQNLDILLLSDGEKKLATAFEAYGEKKNYGKTYMGIIRSSFLIDTKTQEVLQSWKNVKATGHAERICKLV